MKYSLLIVFILISIISPEIFAAPKLPGTDESSKLEAAGTLLRLLDTMIFVWGARIGAAMCILSGGWALKEQRFGTAVISILAAIVIATAPVWVRNLFEIGGGSVFS
jgi:hypothetical protein